MTPDHWPLVETLCRAATAPLPLAAAVDWFKIVIWVVVIGAWAINQLMAMKNKAEAAKPKLPQPPRPQGNPAAGPRGLLDEVERFLKDARKNVEQAQQRSTKPPAASGGRPKPAKTSQAQRSNKERQKPKPPQPPRRKVEPERVVDDVERGGSVAQHVKQHLDTSRFDQRAEQLSKLRQTIDQDIGAHVKSVFDHQVGTLASSSTPAAEVESAPPPAQTLAALLRDPQGVRNAVILQEILRPPVDRW